MDIIYYRSPTGNFGDDLNAVLWREILPPSCFAASDAILLGVGSIFRDDFLTPSATRNKRVFVLSSGAGTGPLPSLWPNSEWTILAVRGPLSARLIGRPEAAVTDGAALLAVTKTLLPDRSEQPDIAFIPHYNSIQFSRWSEACDLAGFTYVDARWPPQRVLQTLGRARLVITEAMHGAIVADTLRIPWIPVVSSPSILPFKWADWAKSLMLEYRPLTLPPSSGWEALKHLKIRLTDPRHTRTATTSECDQAFIDEFYRRFGAVTVERLYGRRSLDTATTAAMHKMTALFDSIFTARAAAALTAVSTTRAYLSDDKVLADRVERLQESAGALVRALSAAA
jgi:succinoglycan biosynthesis protein ExoV